MRLRSVRILHPCQQTACYQLPVRSCLVSLLNGHAEVHLAAQPLGPQRTVDFTSHTALSAVRVPRMNRQTRWQT
ncbi:hypothetical protein CEE69_06010 [Rhodopirellula bahusiensis]|uniref:Uncharacterized protein n=1 Tax=Rhodopirellula bahusiensis TaxID=2014065 RepID=A0A2G1WAZ2_9BACT|nr:hypothetical protein CEE69_06010 [Rhodopirellula bahusiensis]